MAKYHMNKAEREITDPGIIADILKAGKYAVIAMCRENEPNVVTLSYGYDAGQSCLYFHTAPTGLKLDFVRETTGKAGW
ncbi:pyridoxamine 5'-phosphate oxidase family protein [Methanocella sp. MCL-LM]|uniref:pyridoxamine 5'-phosphate oxidase family protein n=1 Tax=Methanocella sp. MCL-LM TaxID=3412035 RepID=UPI003C79089A